jgi:hypothetical protein
LQKVPAAAAVVRQDIAVESQVQQQQLRLCRCKRDRLSHLQRQQQCNYAQGLKTNAVAAAAAVEQVCVKH